MNSLPRYLCLGLFGLACSSAALAADSTPTVSEKKETASLALPPAIPGFPVGWCIRAEPEVVADAKAAGFEYVDLAMQDVIAKSPEDFTKLVNQLQTSGMRALAGYNSVPKMIKLVGPDVNKSWQEGHLTALIARASALKLTYLILNAGGSWQVPEGFSREEAFSQVADFCRRFADAAAKENITVLIEPLRSTDSNMLITIAEAVKLVETVKHPHFHLMVDYSFMMITKDDPAALLKAGKHLKHVHIANPTPTPRVYPMDESESDYAAFFRVLKQIDYRGGLSVHAGTKSFATEAPRAIAFLRRQGAQLAGSSNGR
jgi:D-psicose/D-tagatose/L-ribulose 3-epimerase